MKFFLIPILLTIAAVLGLFFGFGPQAALTAILLIILEVTLSFDNAVVNAKVLKEMSEKWRHRFLTWGMLIAVFGVRFVLPIVIVSLSVWMSPWVVTQLALFDPAEYGHLLHNAHPAISAFGGTFLLMVALKYFLDREKTLHWIQVVEHHLSKWGRVEAIEIGVALVALLGISLIVPAEEKIVVLFAGVVGIALFIFMQGIASAFSVESTEAAARGLAFFIYLEILDTAFSLDSVVGAFALTTAIPVIVIGLGIGAYFVRSLTLYMVEKKTLDTLRYLEHGAHWAIFGLAISMFTSLLFEVPEIITGTVGLAFVLAAYYSSLQIQKR